MSAAKSRATRLEGALRSDAELLVAIQRDDLGALGILYDRHARAVFAVLHRVTHGASDVDDILHATFLDVLKVASAYDGRASARSWLIGIAVRRALRHSRTAARFARMLARFAHLAPRAQTVDPEAHAASRARLAVLDAAIGRLSPAKRAVFVLIEGEGFSAEDVGRQLGVPTATVRTRLYHAKRELLGALAKAGEP